MPLKNDGDVQVLAGLSLALEKEYIEDGLEWHGSPFAWIKTRPSRQVGAIGEKLVSGFFATKGFNVVRSPDSNADRIIENVRVEVKFSTLWKSGVYKFQQLRDQDYDVAICLGVSPLDAHCWVIEKPEILRRWRARDGIDSQHRGAEGSDTAWLSVSPLTVPQWLATRGGSLGQAVKIFAGLSGYRPSE